jgi:hypothetical protein
VDPHVFDPSDVPFFDERIVRKTGSTFSHDALGLNWQPSLQSPWTSPLSEISHMSLHWRTAERGNF